MITARIYFKTAMTNVRIEDVLDSYTVVGKWSKAKKDDQGEFSAADIGGLATVDIHGEGSDPNGYYRRVNLGNGDQCDFPLTEPSVRNEAEESSASGDAARLEDKLSGTAPAAKSSRKTTSSVEKVPK
jgi:hypothetical protein